MTMLRTIKCDIPGCHTEETEKEYGAGWHGWAILNGIAINQPLVPSDMTIYFCPRHTIELGNKIDEIIDEE